MNTITKSILNKNLTWIQHSNALDVSYRYSELSKRIDQWKYILAVKHNARKGQCVALAFAAVSLDYFATVFAAAELGLKLIVLDKPITPKTLHKTRAAFFAPIDFGIEGDLETHPLHHMMMQKYCNVLISSTEINDATETFDGVYAEPDDVLLCASTSGTTGDPLPVLFTHREVYEISLRNVDVFGFKENSSVGHFKTMHHASSLLTFMFPALMIANTHVECKTEENGFDTSIFPDMVSRVHRYHIDHLQLVNYYAVLKFVDSLEASEKNLDTVVSLNISGFTVPDSFYNIAKKYPINFVSHFGSVDTGIPLLVNTVTKNSKFQENYLGRLPDAFYGLHLNDGKAFVTSKFWEGERPLSDKLRNDGMDWYHGGRLVPNLLENRIKGMLTDVDLMVCYAESKLFLVIWDKDIAIPENVAKLVDSVVYLDKELFTPETKVNVTQLKAYLSCM